MNFLDKSKNLPEKFIKFFLIENLNRFPRLHSPKSTIFSEVAKKVLKKQQTEKLYSDIFTFSGILLKIVFSFATKIIKF